MAEPIITNWGLRAFYGAGLEPLREHLVDRIRARPMPPRDNEIVVVQSQGMRQWLEMRIADAFSVAGSLSMPFPGRLGQEVAAWLGIPAPERDAFSRDALMWRIDVLLRELDTADVRYAALAPYLAASDDRMRFVLAARIAGRFDDYQLFRPELLEEWEAGEPGTGSPHAVWQAALWRTLYEGAGAHQARQIATVLERLRSAAPGSLARVPRRISVFGISSLAPRFIELLAALGKHSDVCVYAAVLPETAQHPLAAAFGAQGRALRQLLVEAGAQIEDIGAPQAKSATLLGALRQELVTGDTGDSPLVLAPDDASLRVHLAHGKTRELEVIRDQLYDAFASDATLRPDDVLLLVPDVTEWGPTVNAVFNVPTDGPAPIPCSVADRRSREGPAADALLRLLALEGGRLAHSELFSVLQLPLARVAAELEDSAVERLSALTRDANVRWGYDEHAVEEIGLPITDAPTWRRGLDRLLMGVAAGRLDDEVLGVLPQAGDTTGDAESLAKLSRWVDRIGELLEDWRRERTLEEWSATFSRLVDDFLRSETQRDREQILALQTAVRALTEQARAGRHTLRVSFGVARDWVESALEDDSAGGGFLSGKVTVAALKPMRSLPFRVIAIAGLDDASFPRRDRQLAFDLIAQFPRPGDRSLREDDRQLFLDLLLAAKDRLILTFTGRAARDNSPRAPSVVLDELLDHLDRRTGDSARKLLVVEHPLQPFSERYFTGAGESRLFTYSRTAANAAESRASGTGDGMPFITSELPPADAVPVSEITLRDLREFWENPSRWFCQQQLGLWLPDSADDTSVDSELFSLDAMQQGGVRHQMLKSELAGRRELERESRTMIAGGTLPPGALGAIWHGTLSDEVALVAAAMPAGESTSATLRLEGSGWRLEGAVDQIVGDTRWVLRAGSFRAKHRIHAWVEHVVMCAARQCGEDVPTHTKLIGATNERGVRTLQTDELGDVPNAAAIVEGWVAVLAKGRKRALPFFGNAGAALLDARPSGAVDDAKPKRKSSKAPEDPVEKGMKAAKKAFVRSQYNAFGDDGDAYVSLCFRGEDDILEKYRSEFLQLADALCPGGKLPWA